MFETAMFLDGMEKLVRKCHENSKSKGFWDGPDNDNIPTKLALIHSEVSEFLEAWRVGKQSCGKSMKHPFKDELMPVGYLSGGESVPMSNFEEEAADILIRLCDLCGKLGIDLGRVTLAKMEYNAQRPHKHGGKRV